MNHAWLGVFYIDLNSGEINYYASTVILDKCCGSCNATDRWSTKICVLSYTKDINVKVSKMIRRTKEAKTLIKHFMWLQMQIQ